MQEYVTYFSGVHKVGLSYLSKSEPFLGIESSTSIQWVSFAQKVFYTLLVWKHLKLYVRKK